MYSPHPAPETLAIPPIEPFERLWVTDGLRMTAKRWQVAHHYHWQRQNFHYQALHQTGIIGGLGVVPIPAPEWINAEFRNGRWVQIQPGMAIDAHGNPIVVTRPENFRITFKPPSDTPLRVYLVAQYVNPDNLDHPAGQEQVKELFRIVEKTHLDALDVELCRLEILPETVKIQAAANVYTPGYGELDLRYRAFAQVRPWGMVQVAQVTTGGPQDAIRTEQLTQLLEATDALFPPLRGYPKVAHIPVGAIAQSPLTDYDLLSVPHNALHDLQPIHQTNLKTFLNHGGTVMVVVSTEAVRLGKLVQIKQELIQAIGQTSSGLKTQEIEAEIVAYDAEIQQINQKLREPIERLVQAMNYPTGNYRLDHTHPIRRYPFLFSAMPILEKRQITVYNWGGIIMVIGNLPSLWGLDKHLNQPREAIRSAQELGINLLHFAWRRRHLTRLQQPPTASNPTHFTNGSIPPPL